MLSYWKIVLDKVSFNEQLFLKELNKAMHEITTDEKRELQNWCNYHYGKLYKDKIDFQFNNYTVETVEMD